MQECCGQLRQRIYGYQDTDLNDLRVSSWICHKCIRLEPYWMRFQSFYIIRAEQQD